MMMKNENNDMKNDGEEVTIERKILISICWACLLGVIFSVVAFGYCVATDSSHFITWAFSALVCWWIGSSIADTLKQSKKK